MDKSTLTPLVFTGRILIATMLAISGLAKLASTHVQTTGYVVSDGFPLETAPALLLGAMEILGGICLGLGYRIRLTALAMALLVIGTNLLFHHFWTFAPEFQFAQQLLFMKNLSIAGGLFMLAGIADLVGQDRRDTAMSKH
ncbi:MAG: DoxX family protein [Burkholderiaceae bacterium]